MPLGWLLKAFKPAQRHGFGDAGEPDDPLPTDAEMTAITDWMAANGVSLDDFAMAHFKAPHVLQPSATIVAVGEANFDPGPPIAFYAEAREGTVLRAGKVPHGIFQEVNAMAEEAFSRPEVLADLIEARALAWAG